MIFEKIKNIIVSQLEIDPQRVTMDSYFIEDLGADSLDIIEMVMAIESEFGIEIEDESLEGIQQVKDVVEYFDNK